jgi:hypothetical protein
LFEEAPFIVKVRLSMSLRYDIYKAFDSSGKF